MPRRSPLLLSALAGAVFASASAAAHTPSTVQVHATAGVVEGALEGFPAADEGFTLALIVDDHHVVDQDPALDAGLYPGSVWGGILPAGERAAVDLGEGRLEITVSGDASRMTFTGLAEPDLVAAPQCDEGADPGTGDLLGPCRTRYEVTVDLAADLGTSASVAVDETAYALRSGQAGTVTVERRRCPDGGGECSWELLYRVVPDIQAMRVTFTTPVGETTWGTLKLRYR